MRKTLFYAVATAVLLISCSKETPEIAKQATIRHFTAECSRPESKTAVEDGKQVWRAGDQISVTDGVNTEIVTVPAGDDGKSLISFSTSTITGSKVYAVFPAEASVGKIVDEKMYFRIPNTTEGDFDTANIMIAKTEGSSLSFRNTTSVIRFTLEAADVKQISITSAREASTGSNKNTLAGEFYFDYDSQRTWGAYGEDVSSITVKLNGPGTYYVPVFPCTLEAGAKFIFTDSEGKTAARTTSVDNTFKINKFKSISVDEIVSGLDFNTDWKGTGSLSDPYLITCANDFVKMASASDNFRGKVFRLTADVVLPENFRPIGTSMTFYGYIDGNNHCVTLSSFAENLTYVGMIAQMGGNTTYGISGVTNLDLKGNIVIENDAKMKYYGSLIAYSTGTPNIVGCSSAVDVTASSSTLQYGGGLIGYVSGSNGCRFVGNSNSGRVNLTTSLSRVSRYFGGVYGYVNSSSAVTPTSSFNTGDITVECTISDSYGTYVAGVASSNSNAASLSYCYNQGAITAKSKTTRQNCCCAGGITNNAKCDHSYNAGAVNAYYGASYDLDGYTGGIAGIFQYRAQFRNDFSLEGAAPALFGYNSSGASDSPDQCGVFTRSSEGGHVDELGSDLVTLLGTSYFKPGPAPYFYPEHK